MHKLWLSLLIVGICVTFPQKIAADGVNAGLADPAVVPSGQRAPLSATAGVPNVLPGSNQVGRPGVSPDQIGGYDVNIAYDHVAVGVAIVAVLFLMTEWMENR